MWLTGTQGTALSAEDAAKLNADDKATVTTTAEDAGFPYQSFTVKVPESLAADATASTTIRWNGSAEAGSDLYAFVRNVTTGRMGSGGPGPGQRKRQGHD